MRFKLLAILLCLMATLCADNSYAQLVKTKRTNADELLEMAQLHYNNRNYYKAIQVCKQGLQRRPDYVDLHFLLGRAYVQVNQFDSARLEFQYVLHEVPRYREAYLAAMNMELKIGRNQEALCYADDGLYFFPNDREFMLKKLAILETLKYYRYSDNYAQRLVNKYPEDTILLQYYTSYKTEHAAMYMKQGNMARARYEYEKILELSPGNKEALEAITNIEIRSGNYENSLAFVNRALISNPNDYEMLLRKVGLLEELKRYPEAIELSQKMMSLFPGDAKIRTINSELRMAAGRYYMGTDPYIQFQSVLERNPSNRDALNYVISLSFQRGLYDESLNWTNRALRYYPNDRDLINRKIDNLTKLERYGAAADLAERRWKQSPTADNQETFLELKTLAGRQYLQSMDMDSALLTFQKVLEVNPSYPMAMNYSINILAGQKKYDEAIALVDRSLTYYPDDPFLLFKKSAILSEYEKYEEASMIMYDLMVRYPDNERYLNTFIEQKMDYGRLMMKAEEFDNAREQFKAVVELRPSNLDAINYLANIEIATKHYDSALNVVEQGLLMYPNNKDLLVKKSAILENMRDFQNAYQITADLVRRYPYNVKLRQAYIDQLLASGRKYNNEGRADSAIREFKKVLDIAPKDTNALAYLSNTYIQTEQLDSALAYTNKALGYFPENDFFTLKRAVIFEKRNQFDTAFKAADSVLKRNPLNINYIDYANYLLSRTFRNQLGFQFLYSTIEDDNLQRTRANIATIQYLRFLKNNKGTIGGRLNYAGRAIGTGIQVELETYYNHNKKYTSYANVGLANELVFPQLKLAYSIYRNFPKRWEGELGIRYLNFPNFNTTSVSILAGVARTYGDFWANIKGYTIAAQGQNYFAAQFTARQYLNDKSDFLSATFGYGNSPDEFSRNQLLPTNLGNPTYNIGVGYQKVFAYRNTLSINGNWFNQKKGTGTFRNQYDIFVQFLRKF
ncbi:MAG: tetratricopeptide repeat protein [Chitinophagaceae bacterium]